MLNDTNAAAQLATPDHDTKHEETEHVGMLIATKLIAASDSEKRCAYLEKQVARKDTELEREKSEHARTHQQLDAVFEVAVRLKKREGLTDGQARDWCWEELRDHGR